MSISTAKSEAAVSALRDPTPWFVRFQRLLDEMTDGEKRVGSYFMEHPDAAQKSIGELIYVSGLGYGTVIRFCQKLGCRGFQEFKVLMARDAIAASPARPAGGTGAHDAIVERLNEDISRTAQNLDVREIQKAAEALCKASRVVCIGVASSAPLALSLDWKIKRFGIPSSFVSDGYVMAVEAALLGPGTVLVAVSSSGATKDIVTAARLAREGGATVIAVTNFTKAPLDRAGQHPAHHIGHPRPSHRRSAVHRRRRGGVRDSHRRNPAAESRGRRDRARNVQRNRRPEAVGLVRLGCKLARSASEGNTVDLPRSQFGLCTQRRDGHWQSQWHTGRVQAVEPVTLNGDAGWPRRVAQLRRVRPSSAPVWQAAAVQRRRRGPCNTRSPCPRS